MILNTHPLLNQVSEWLKAYDELLQITQNFDNTMDINDLKMFPKRYVELIASMNSITDEMRLMTGIFQNYLPASSRDFMDLAISDQN